MTPNAYRQFMSESFDRLEAYLLTLYVPTPLTRRIPMTQMANSVESDREIVLERVFDAPRSLVYKAYTDPGHLPYWFGPKGFTITSHGLDVRDGGSWRFVMHGPDGTDYQNFTRYIHVVPNEKLVYEMGDLPENPPQFDVTLTFADENGRTRLTQRMVFPTAEACNAVKAFGAIELGQQTLDKLADRLKTMGLAITRTFNAPRELVYKAWTDPQAFAQWWGPVGFQVDVKEGRIEQDGTFHYRMYNEGGEMWGRIAYVELSPPERIIFINSFSDPEGNITRAPFMPDFPARVLNVVTFLEQDGKTIMNIAGGPLDANEAETAAYERMHVSMQGGFRATFDQLEAFLARQ